MVKGYDTGSMDTPLNPAQRAVLDLLGCPLAERPVFDPELATDLRHELEEALAPLVADRSEDDPLKIKKHRLSRVHGCEARFVAEDDQPFRPTPATVRGTIAHKAIELAMNWPGEANPLDLVDEATARFAESDRWLADWLQTAGEADRAELRGEAGARVAKFLECFPPLATRWRPVPESRYTADLCDGRIVLDGKVDLTLGTATGDRAGKVLIDLKTGGFSVDHAHDLRFYALIETLRLGVPPRLIATYDLDRARAVPEEVSEAVLRSAVARTVDGVVRIVELTGGSRPVTTTPSAACRWCLIQRECPEGSDYLRRSEADSPLQ